MRSPCERSRSASSSLRTAPTESKPSSLRWRAVASPMPVRRLSRARFRWPWRDPTSAGIRARVLRTKASGAETGACARLSLASAAVELEDAIRTRRTHKAYGAEPVPRELLEELLELARWAPNHNLTNPWRFRVVGPDSLAALKAGRRAGGRRQARPGAHARGREPGALGRPDPGRGGPLRRGVRDQLRPARGALPRAGRLLAHPGCCAPRAGRPSACPRTSACWA